MCNGRTSWGRRHRAWTARGGVTPDFLSHYRDILPTEILLSGWSVQSWILVSVFLQWPLSMVLFKTFTDTFLHITFAGLVCVCLLTDHVTTWLVETSMELKKVTCTLHQDLSISAIRQSFKVMMMMVIWRLDFVFATSTNVFSTSIGCLIMNAF